MADTVAIKKDESNPVLPEVLESAIVKLGDAVMAWNRYGMKKRALIVLLHDLTRVSKRDIELVLNGMQGLQAEYCLPTSAATKK